MGYNILSIDELGVTRLEFAGMLKNLNINITGVKDEIEAINVLHANKSSINAIMWTINTIDLKEFDAIKRIKSKDSYKHIPIIVISKFTDKKYIIKAIECGVVEFIAKPYDTETVLKKVGKVLGVSLEEKASKKGKDDSVTFNFSEMLSREVKAASRGQYPMSLALISIASEANNSESEEDMDDIINLISKVIRTKLRETDTIFRYSTGNLILLLPFANNEGVGIVERKIQNIFKSHSLIKQKNKGYSLITASVTYPDDGKIKDKLLEKLERNFSENSKSKV